MSWDNVPWLVGGGALHSAEVGRLLAYVAFRGNEGVLAPGDLKVQALSTPDSAVTVDNGACAILCRAAGQEAQAYAGRLPAQDTVSIAATGSGAGRSDLIVARVEDPWLAGEPWADPADPAVGPYIFTRVIQGVPSTTTSVTELSLGYSAIPLARIDIPASTSTITSAMITDLRKVANPRRERRLLNYYPSSNNDLTSGSFVTWPSVAATTIAVPSWAAGAIVRATVSSSALITASATGWLRANLGGLVTQASGIDENYTGSTSRFTTVVGGTLSIPSSMRGTNQIVKLEGERVSGTGAFRADGATSAFIDVEFFEAAA